MNRCDLTNKQMGRLKILYYSFSKKGRTYWHCKCSCGTEIDVNSHDLNRGAIKSCGCLKRETVSKRMKTHGQSDTRLYYIWESMKRRCEKVKVGKAYNNYYKRGIKICEEWHNFNNFFKWAYENGYKDNLTIDRINNNGNYCPDNCRWVNNKTQQNNKRSNVFLTYNNKTQTISQWAEELGMKYNTLDERLRHGWSVEKALTQPVRK